MAHKVIYLKYGKEFDHDKDSLKQMQSVGVIETNGTGT